jgi:hypothetical protein
MRLASSFCLLVVLAGISAAQDTNFSEGPQYLMTAGSPMFARPIATPSLSLQSPLPAISSFPEIEPPTDNQTVLANPELGHEANLFPVYYGYRMPTVVELTATEEPLELPQSLSNAGVVNAGVVGMTDPQSLRERGYGIPLAEVASFWKAHKARATRVYTNADVERLHGS